MSLTNQTKASDKNVTAIPKTALSVGNKKNKIIFKNPKIRIALTKGKATMVQMLANGVIV
jgi:hypothetical protein